MPLSMKKVGAGARLLFDSGTWRIVLDEARRRRPPLSEPPTVRVVEEDAHAGLRLLDVAGQRYWLPLAMDWSGMAMLYPEVFCVDHPHYYESSWCRVRAGDVVIDAGASEGLFTRFALDRGAKVIAVEPWGPMAEALRRTFAAEIAAGTVHVVPAALAEREGEVTLQLDPSQPWGAMVDGRGPASATVPQTTVDRLVAASPWGRCDFLKMDVEGVERRVVAGAVETLRRDRPCLSIAVYHHATGYLDIRGDLRATGLGYRVHGKGLHRRRIVYFPTILHAWTPERES